MARSREPARRARTALPHPNPNPYPNPDLTLSSVADLSVQEPGDGEGEGEGKGKGEGRELWRRTGQRAFSARRLYRGSETEAAGRQPAGPPRLVSKVRLPQRCSTDPPSPIECPRCGGALWCQSVAFRHRTVSCISAPHSANALVIVAAAICHQFVSPMCRCPSVPVSCILAPTRS